MRKDLFWSIKISTFVLLFILLFNLIALAETATVDEAQRVCRNWLTYTVFQKGDWAGSTEPKIISTQEIRSDDTLLGWYFEIDPAGYVVVPILKDLPAIKATSQESRMDPEAEDGFAAMLREVIQNRARAFVKVYGSLDAAQPKSGQVLLGRRHHQMWDVLLVDENKFLDSLPPEDKAKYVELGPLMTTHWDQGDPYNLYCPWGDGGRCVVGCVATAAAQILAYHKWPPQGTGTNLYYWAGDYSCGGSTPGQYLTADFSDSYDWDNIVDYCGTCTPEQEAALAELNYEVGVAFNMMYGRCGSGSYVYQAQQVFPEFFRYRDNIELHDRPDYFLYDWSNMIKTEIEANRPIQYRIYSHSIVADGWRYPIGDYQVHMNYGWNSGHNAWYSIDDFYCPWSGCTPNVEMMVTHIEPDRGVYFASDTAWGDVPLTVNFDGNSSLDVENWIWDFGDGDSSFIQSPTHTYEQNGQFDVTLQATGGGETRTYKATNYITALADSICSPVVQGDAGSQVEVDIYARNSVPIRRFTVPVEYSGTLALTLDSFSVSGCRTEYFDRNINVALDPYNRRSAYSLQVLSSSLPDLDPGYGPILKLYFTIPSSAMGNQYAEIALDGFYTYYPMFYGPVLNFTPKLEAGRVELPYMCGDPNDDGTINIFDATYIISYLYLGGPPPQEMASADVNNSGDINIFDVTHIITFLYNSGPEPQCP
jgi:PKD repeat protein